MDGWLYGRMSAHGTGNSVAFIYPDFKTALRGRFENFTMVEAREVQVWKHR